MVSLKWVSAKVSEEYTGSRTTRRQKQLTAISSNALFCYALASYMSVLGSRIPTIRNSKLTSTIFAQSIHLSWLIAICYELSMIHRESFSYDFIEILRLRNFLIKKEHKRNDLYRRLATTLRYRWWKRSSVPAIINNMKLKHYLFINST
jgi:hypothetical protein